MSGFSLKPQATRFGMKSAAPSTAFVMGQVMLALIPGTLVMSAYLGVGVLINVVVLVLASLACEGIVLRCRQRVVQTSLMDGSIVLAAWLLALCLPPSLPITHLLVGAVAMTLLGKHVYGGLGQNPFNPAMVAYAILILSFPKTMTYWLEPYALEGWLTRFIDGSHWLEWWQLKWQGVMENTQWDAITQATPLDRLRDLDRQSLPIEVSEFDLTPWREISIAWLIGGVYLLVRKVIRWHLPASMLVGAVIAHGVHGYLFPLQALPMSHMMIYGAVVFGAFFIATDPVTAPSSRRARLAYGAGIGVLTVILRTGSNFPEGVAFAVLLMNAATPLLDRIFVLDKRA